MTTLYLHIGMPKTGTTFLQAILAGNEAVLADAGLVYPRRWRNGENLAHHVLGRALATDGGGHGGADTVEDFLRFVVETDDARDILVSSEAITNALQSKRLPAFLDFVDRLRAIRPLKVVVYLRRIDRFFESMYLHSVKIGELSQPFDAYLAGRRRWADQLFAGLAALRERPSLQLDIRIFEDHEDLVADLLEALDRPKARLEYRNVGTNSKLGVKMQSALLHLPQLLPAEMLEKVDRLSLIAALERERLAFEGDRYSYTILDPRVRAELLADARQAAAEHGIEPYLRAYDEHVPELYCTSLDRELPDAAAIEELERFVSEQVVPRPASGVAAR